MNGPLPDQRYSTVSWRLNAGSAMGRPRENGRRPKPQGKGIRGRRVAIRRLGGPSNLRIATWLTACKLEVALCRERTALPRALIRQPGSPRPAPPPDPERPVEIGDHPARSAPRPLAPPT